MAELDATRNVYAVPTPTEILPTFITLHAMLHIVMRNQTVFEDSHVVSGKWSFDEEDLLRAYTLILAIANHVSKNDKITDKTAVKQAFEAGQNNVAIPPFYYDIVTERLEKEKQERILGRPKDSKTLSYLIGGKDTEALIRDKIFSIKASLDPEQEHKQGFEPSESENRRMKAALKRVYGSSMAKISELGQLQRGEQDNTLAAIFTKVKFVVNGAEHLTTDADLPDLESLDVEHSELTEAVVRFRAGAEIEQPEERSDREPLPPLRVPDEDEAEIARKLAAYGVRLAANREARVKRESELKTFKEHMEQSRLTSVATESYRSACTRLGLDVKNPTVGSGNNIITLKPWQVTGLSYLLHDVPKGRRGHLLSDDCGLGKTLMILELEARSKERELEKARAGEAADFRPSIIWCPANLIGVWLKEYEKYYQSRFTMRVYAWSSATMSTADPRYKFMIDHNELARELLVPGGSLHRDNVDAIRTTVLCPYQTFSLRTLISNDDYNESVARFEAEIRDRKKVSR